MQEKRTTILGAARSGLAAAKLFAEHDYRVFVSDHAPAAKMRKAINTLLRLEIPYEFGRHSDRVFQTDFVILSPGIPVTSDIVQQIRSRDIPVYSEIEAASWFCRSPIAAVTGSNGKTTTTTLLGRILKSQMRNALVAGNIGQPFAGIVSESRPDSWVALEVSSFQLETIMDFHPRIAVILNLAPNHLDWYDSFEDYITAKLRILMNMNADDFLIYNGDDRLLTEKIMNYPCRKIKFSLNSVRSEAYLKNSDIYLYNEPAIDTGRLKISGPHNYQNIMAAALAGSIAGVSRENIRETAEAFKGVSHRQEYIGQAGGIGFVNDSKATTIESLRVALYSFDRPVILIAGGKDKGGDFKSLRPHVKKQVRHAVLIGAAHDKIAGAWKDVIPVHSAGSMEEAVQTAFQLAQPGETVLLSPACASFDMYDNFEERGRHFKTIARDLIRRHESQ